MPIPADVPEIAVMVTAAPPRCGSTRLVCIDGPAGSGKTTLAVALSDALAAASGVAPVGAPVGVPVVHMDDLYEGWDQQLGGPLAARVEAWLLLAWESGLHGMHPRYDWGAGRFAEWAEVPAAPVVILEGCGSGSAGIRDRAALLVWVEAPADVRIDRGVSRDGAEMTDRWLTWQVHEAAHFEADGTRDAAHIVVDGRTGRFVP